MSIGPVSPKHNQRKFTKERQTNRVNETQQTPLKLDNGQHLHNRRPLGCGGKRGNFCFLRGAAVDDRYGAPFVNERIAIKSACGVFKTQTRGGSIVIETSTQGLAAKRWIFQKTSIVPKLSPGGQRSQVAKPFVVVMGRNVEST